MSKVESWAVANVENELTKGSWMVMEIGRDLENKIFKHLNIFSCCTFPQLMLKFVQEECKGPVADFIFFFSVYCVHATQGKVALLNSLYSSISSAGEGENTSTSA